MGAPGIARRETPVDRTGSPKSRRMLIAAAIILAAATIAGWIALLPASPARNDFAPGYASALLLREGRPSAIYDSAAQRATLIAVSGDAAPTTAPTALAPPAVLLEAPLTLLPLWPASLVWSLLQVLLVLCAATVAVRAVPRGRSLAPGARFFLVAAAGCGGGTLMLLSLNQWDGIAALGLALVYSELRRGHDARAMAWLTLAVLAGKPHLGLGIALFLAVRRPRTVLAAVATGAAVYGLTVLVVPPSTIAQWFSTVVHVGSLIPTSTTIGLSGMTSETLGSSPAATIIGLAASAAALAAAAALGAWDARRAHGADIGEGVRLETLFTCATLLSLLGAPHVFPYDLVLLVPGFIGCASWCETDAEARRWPQRRAFVVLALWGVLTLTCWALLWPPGSYRTTPLLTLLLLGAAALCAGVALRHDRGRRAARASLRRAPSRG